MLDHSIPPSAAILVAFIVALVVSYAVHIAIEVPTKRLGKEPRWRRLSGPAHNCGYGSLRSQGRHTAKVICPSG
jgi:peptidoglycan/LPS O-acetylase OafA/YrhL